MQTDNLYLHRINLVINYIRDHLTDDLSLDTLARVACFSPFHFHRIFTTITGETVNQCVNRLRLERAAALLKASPRLSITEAAFACGFTSASSFARAFKKHFGLTARAWDRQSALENSKNGQVLDGFPRYSVEALSEVADTGEFAVQVRALPAMRLAYIRVFNSYRPAPILRAYNRLIDWYCGRSGDLAQTTLYGMSQDDPEVTPLKLCRFDWCLSVPDSWRADVVDNQVGVVEFPACQIATIHCQGDIFRLDRAWQYLYRYWLPRSRYQPDNRPAMEIYHCQPVEIGWESYDMECALPIVSL